ncbi:MAG TPA: hypothetical protein VFV70_02370, partial [Hyphomonadaceae bacterium]|nr:hypothetical protein [Hyphomonadaceae bacterium]
MSKIAMLCLVGGLCFAAPASADIREFNSAVNARDYRMASIAAAETWPQLDKSAPDIAIIAREFSWVAMLAGQPAAAQVYARFLTEQGRSLPKPDPTPAVSRVLFEWSALAKTPTAENRARLLTALQQRAASPGKDLISVRAAQLLFSKSWDAGEWATAGKASDMALNLMRQLGREYDLERYDLRRGRIAADFMRTRLPQTYNQMYDLAEEIYGVAASIGSPSDQLATEFFTTTAWGDVIFEAVRGRGLTNRSATVTRGRMSANDLFFPAPGQASMPRCRITVASTSRQPGFPNPQAAYGLNGVAVYAVTLAPGGRYSDAKILGSAPNNEFSDAMDKVLPYWRWELDPRTPA